MISTTCSELKSKGAREHIGIQLVHRVARRGFWRFLLAIGALAVAGYAYYDTEQVSQTTVEFYRFEVTVVTSPLVLLPLLGYSNKESETQTTLLPVQEKISNISTFFTI
jgi:hypothetical protein